MVGSRMFSQIDDRLRQIKGINKSFGGVSVIVVGDLFQLPPVMDRPIFLPPNTGPTSILAESVLWKEFHLFELTQIMRQKDEKDLIVALNNMAAGKTTKDDIQLFQSRMVKAIDVPSSAIRLFAENKAVDAFNDHRIKMTKGDLYESVAVDTIISNVGKKQKSSKILESFKKKSIKDTNGMPLLLKISVSK